MVFGNEYVYNSAAIGGTNKVRWLDSSRFIVVYRDDGNSSYSTAQVGTVSGDVVIYGSKYVFNTTGRTFPTFDIVDTDKIVCTSNAPTAGSAGSAVVGGSISGDVITFGSIVNLPMIQYSQVVKLDTNKFFIVYNASSDGSSSNRSNYITGTLSGTTLTLSSPTQIATHNALFIRGAAIDTDRVFFIYRRSDNSTTEARIYDDGTGVGSATVLTDVSTPHDVGKISTTQVVVGFRDSDGTGALIADISGSTITINSKYLIYVGSSSVNNSLSVFNSGSSFLYAYRDGTNSNIGTVVEGTISGTTITYDIPVVFNTADSNFIGIDFKNDVDFVISYQDIGNSNYGTAILGATSNIDDIDGNLTLFGTMDVIINFIDDVDGGITLSGSFEAGRIINYDLDGSITLSGDMTQLITYVVGVDGTVSISGELERVINYSEDIDGQLNLLGNFDYTTTYFNNIDGQLTLSGDLDYNTDYLIDADGTITISGGFEDLGVIFKGKEVSSTSKITLNISAVSKIIRESKNLSKMR